MRTILAYIWNNLGYSVLQLTKRVLSFFYHYNGGSVSLNMSDSRWMIQKHYYIFNHHIHTAFYHDDKPLKKCIWHYRER